MEKIIEYNGHEIKDEYIVNRLKEGKINIIEASILQYLIEDGEK